MRNLALFSLVLLLSLSYTALAGLQLGGDNGRAILESLTENTTTENAANQSSANSSTANSSTAEPVDLWSWGKIPIGHMLNSSGVLTETPRQDDPLVVVPPRGIPP